MLLFSSPLSDESESAKSKFWLTAHVQPYSRHHNITSKEVFPMNFTLANTAITARALLDFLDEYRVSVAHDKSHPQMPTDANTCPQMPTHANTYQHMPTHTHTCPQVPTGANKIKTTFFGLYLPILGHFCHF